MLKEFLAPSVQVLTPSEHLMEDSRGSWCSRKVGGSKHPFVVCFHPIL